MGVGWGVGWGGVGWGGVGWGGVWGGVGWGGVGWGGGGVPHPEKEEGQKEKGFVVCCPFFENMQKNVAPALGRGLGKSEGISTLYARTLQLVVGSVVWS